MTREQARERNKKILAAHRADPDATYPALAKEFGISVTHVRNIIVDVMLKEEANWHKRTSSERKLVLCKRNQCKVWFETARGYDGSQARYCPGHRHHSRVGRRITAVKKQTCAGCGITFHSPRKMTYHNNDCRLAHFPPPRKEKQND